MNSIQVLFNFSADARPPFQVGIVVAVSKDYLQMALAGKALTEWGMENVHGPSCFVLLRGKLPLDLLLKTKL